MFWIKQGKVSYNVLFMKNYNFMVFYYFISFYLPYHSIMIVQLTKLY